LNEHSADALRFREAMSRVVASVHVVTTDGPAGRHGSTATSVASITDEPPTLIVCLNRAGRSHRLARENGVLAVNVLAAEHEALARAFALSSGGAPDDRFSHGVWDTLATGAPTLRGAVAAFDGRMQKETIVGTHLALFLRIEAVRFADPCPPRLLYAGRAYHSFPLR
jgi:flavin reductase (DIM6/NTAB) family NADH-FMN oxidoreductase RutF